MGWGVHLLCQRSMGLAPELSVSPPVGHVCPDRVPPLLPEHLLYQLSAGHIHHDHRAVLWLPQRTVDLAVLDLWANSVREWVTRRVSKRATYNRPQTWTFINTTSCWLWSENGPTIRTFTSENWCVQRYYFTYDFQLKGSVHRNY